MRFSASTRARCRSCCDRWSRVMCRRAAGRKLRARKSGSPPRARFTSKNDRARAPVVGGRSGRWMREPRGGPDLLFQTRARAVSHGASQRALLAHGPDPARRGARGHALGLRGRRACHPDGAAAWAAEPRSRSTHCLRPHHPRLDRRLADAPRVVALPGPGACSNGARAQPASRVPALPGLMPLLLERGLIAFGIVWFINAVNFLDGLDWMTVVQVVPIALAIAVLNAL